MTLKNDLVAARVASINEEISALQAQINALVESRRDLIRKAGGTVEWYSYGQYGAGNWIETLPDKARNIQISVDRHDAEQRQRMREVMRREYAPVVALPGGGAMVGVWQKAEGNTGYFPVPRHVPAETVLKALQHFSPSGFWEETVKYDAEEHAVVMTENDYDD